MNTDRHTGAIGAGAAVLLAAPLLAIVGVATLPTVSDEAKAQVEAFADHRSAMIAGVTMQAISISLLIGGIIWLAYSLRGRVGRLAVVGGILGAAGSLVPLFEDGVNATGAAIVSVLGPAKAATVIDHIHSGAITAVEPFSLVGDLGLALLGVAAVKAGAPRWVGAAVVAGAFAEGIGFGSSTRALILAGFAVLVAGLAQIVRHFSVTTRDDQVSAPAFA